MMCDITAAALQQTVENTVTCVRVAQCDWTQREVWNTCVGGWRKSTMFPLHIVSVNGKKKTNNLTHLKLTH